MGKETGFLEFDREDRTYRDPEERLTHYKEFVVPLSEKQLRNQAARCMNCGIPYCHNGCPVNNIIPDWNHLVYEDDWKNALEVLHSTNNFPEFTGRVCPAPCEAACTLNIVDSPVTIKSIECAIIDRGFQEGWVKPEVPEKRTGKSVAVIGSGPAGLACAQQLARAGHAVTVFEKSDRIGGLLRYGIPDFKMEKHLINRRAVQMEAEGVQFRTSSEVGVEVSFQALQENFDAVVKVHLYGAFNTSRAAADYFREQESGALVHMTSTSGLIGNLAQANYSAAKLGIAAFSKSVALDLKRWNVRSNCIAPFAWSRMISSIKTDTPEQVARVEKIKEMTPAKVAPMACFLMSDRAADVSGQIFAVRKNEIFLFNQPRPIRSVHSGDGWTADEIAERAIPALKSQFTPLEVSADVFSWDPV